MAAAIVVFSLLSKSVFDKQDERASEKLLTSFFDNNGNFKALNMHSITHIMYIQVEMLPAIKMFKFLSY